MKQLNLWDYSGLPFEVRTDVAANLLDCSASNLSRCKRLNQPCYGRYREFTVIARYAHTEKNRDWWTISWERSSVVA